MKVSSSTSIIPMTQTGHMDQAGDSTDRESLEVTSTWALEDMINFTFKGVANSSLKGKEVGQLIFNIVTIIPISGEKLKWLNGYHPHAAYHIS
jgi:hypothetical protein